MSQQNADSVLNSNKVKEVRVYHNQKLVATKLYHENLQPKLFLFDRFITMLWSKSIFNDHGLEIESKYINPYYPFDTTHLKIVYDSNMKIQFKKDPITDQIRYNYKYDDNRRLVEEKYFSENSELVYVKELKYNASGQLSELKQVYTNNEWCLDRTRCLTMAPETTYYYYDDLGNEVQQETILGNETATTNAENENRKYRTEFEYGSTNLLSKISYTEGGKQYIIDFKYDKKGRLSRKIHRRKNSSYIVEKLKFTYLKNGLIKHYSEQSSTNINPKKYKYLYEYFK